MLRVMLEVEDLVVVEEVALSLSQGGQIVHQTLNQELQIPVEAAVEQILNQMLQVMEDLE